MADHRFTLALGNFEKALARLHEVLVLDETDIVRDALIQRFEFTFETGWQAAYWWLRARGADVTKEAFEVLRRRGPAPCGPQPAPVAARVHGPGDRHRGRGGRPGDAYRSG